MKSDDLIKYFGYFILANVFWRFLKHGLGLPVHDPCATPQEIIESKLKEVNEQRAKMSLPPLTLVVKQ